MSRLKDLYQNQIVPKLMKEFNLKNSYAVPRVAKVVLNMGVGKAIEDKSELQHAIDTLTDIAGLKAVPTAAKKAISGFKIRKGQAIGARVTLRGERMYEFLDKLFSLALPRTRDFQGLDPKSFDGRGNYHLGITEQTIFLETDPTKLTKIRSLGVNITTTAKNDDEGCVLLKTLGAPF